MSRREDLATPAIARILKQGANVKKSSGSFRVSEEAADLARDYVTLGLQKLAKQSHERLLVARRSTLMEKHGDVREIAAKLMCAKAERPPKGRGKEMRGLSQEGVVRVFEEEAAVERISEASRKAILKFAEDYLFNLGIHAGRYASTAGRETIKVVDIEAAAPGLVGL